jgi:quercetin dioxygenase-like cupin family protein
MIINFDNISETAIHGFKGGNGEMDQKLFADEKVKIMKNILKPGATSGEHAHETNCEMMYVLEGELTCHCDGNTETAKAGMIHYCAKGHRHYFENLTDKDVVFIAFVAEHH